MGNTDGTLDQVAEAYYNSFAVYSIHYLMEQRRYETKFAPWHNRAEHLATLAAEYGGQPQDYALPAYYHEFLAQGNARLEAVTATCHNEGTF